MDAHGSVTFWLEQLQAGEREAYQRLWEGYFARLVALARRRLRGAPRQAADEEDVALSAFDSFFRNAEQGRFPRLADRHDLWQVLVLLTARKAANLAKHERRQKRGGGKVRHASALPEAGTEAAAFAEQIGSEPDPAFAAAVAEECRRLLGLLPDEVLRSVALWKLEGHSNQEIADRMGRALTTVERKLQHIRHIWEQAGAAPRAAAEEGGP
jgi:DNA-directed RNA polymerase specialized sigma24 family protein